MGSEGVIEPTPCELFGYRYLRGMRLLIAAELVMKHGMPQLRASRLVGIPQPLLNAFLHGRRRPEAVKEVAGVDGVKELVSAVAEELVSGRRISACDICRAVLSLKGIRCPDASGAVINSCGERVK